MIATALKVAAATAVVVGGAVLLSAALDAPSRTVSTTTLVDAPREVVWRIVTDFEAYPEWNPYLRVTGERLRVGAALNVQLSTGGDETEVLHATVYVLNPPRKLRWQSRLLAPGLMDVEYEVIVAPSGRNAARVVQRARDEGLLLPLMDRGLDQERLEAMAQALERRAESLS